MEVENGGTAIEQLTVYWKNRLPGEAKGIK
jgi:hypothetical protein